MASARSLAELLEQSWRYVDHCDDTTSSEDDSPTRSRSASQCPSELSVFDRPVTRRSAAENQVKLFPVLWTNSTSSVEKFFDAANDAAETIGMPLELDSSVREDEDDDDDGDDEDDTCEDSPPTRKTPQSPTSTTLKSPSISEPRSGRKRKRPHRRYTKPYRSRPAKQPQREADLGTGVAKGHGSPPSNCHGRPMYELLETGHGPLIPKQLSTGNAACYPGCKSPEFERNGRVVVPTSRTTPADRPSNYQNCNVSPEALASHLVFITEHVLLNLDRSYHMFKSDELQMMERGYRLLCDYFRPPFDIYQVVQFPILFLLPENVNDTICYHYVLLFLLYMKLKNGGRLKGILNHPYVE